MWHVYVQLVYLYVREPCFHILMRAHLSANQSAHTILVIIVFIKLCHYYQCIKCNYFKKKANAHLYTFNVTNIILKWLINEHFTIT